MPIAPNPSAAKPPHPLMMPVGHLMRPTSAIAAEDSLERAVSELRKSGASTLPVTQDGRFVGVIGERCLLHALAEGIDLLAPCIDAKCPAKTVRPYATGSEALRMFSDFQVQTLVVTDDHDRVMGLLSPSDLYPRKWSLPRPASVGGMATPFGVYLTNGGQKGGASLFAVMATGALMFMVLAACTMAAAPLTEPILHSHMPDFLKDMLIKAIPLAAFPIALRLLPLAGTHGAEHMVVHAMERGEELTPEVVARMPRVHPRCGTNLAVAMTMFLTIYTVAWIPYDDVRLLTAVILTLFSWRPVGSFAQQYLTTKKPSEAQIRSGIKAGNELIERYATAHSTSVSVPKRIWNSGMLHVIGGSVLCWLALEGLSKLFKFNLPGLM